jgi:hypothetical protein
MDRWRVGEDIGSKETDGCTLTLWKLIFNSMSSSLHKSIWLTLDHSLKTKYVAHVSGHLRTFQYM